MPYPNYGVNRRDLDHLLCLLGGRVEMVRRTGEVRYSHPLILETARANSRRKDAPRNLVTFVRRVVDLVTANDPVNRFEARGRNGP